MRMGMVLGACATSGGYATAGCARDRKATNPHATAGMVLTQLSPYVFTGIGKARYICSSDAEHRGGVRSGLT